MRRTLAVKNCNSVYSVPVEEIVYLENERRKIRLHLNDRDILFYGTFDEVQEQLGDQFLRCGRSFILNRDRILELNPGRQYEIVMDDGSRISMCKTTFLRVKKKFELYLRKGPVKT